MIKFWLPIDTARVNLGVYWILLYIKLKAEYSSMYSMDCMQEAPKLPLLVIAESQKCFI